MKIRSGAIALIVGCCLLPTMAEAGLLGFLWPQRPELASLPVPADVFANPAPGGGYVGWQRSDSAAIGGYEITAATLLSSQVLKVGADATSVRFDRLIPGWNYSISVRSLDASGSRSRALAATGLHVPRLTLTLRERAAFDRAADYSRSLGGNVVIVMRDGQVVYERRDNGYSGPSSSAILPLASGSKSFSCALLTAAEQDGYLSREGKVADTLTEWLGDPNKSQMTLAQLLGLQGGLSTNPAFKTSQTATLDTYQLALDDPADHAPGSAFIYDPLAFQAFALMFERASGGQDPVDYLQRRVLQPIGLVGDSWQRDLVGHPQIAGGASVAPALWARYGQLMLQHGTWEGRRVLPAAPLADCLTRDNPAYRAYGLTWWLNRDVGDSYDAAVDLVPEDGIASPGSRIAPSAPADMAMAAGVGHQRLYLLPSQRLVVVRMGPLLGELLDWSDEEFLATLLDF
ncbi:serine hydrolase domain-containing protein [Hydrocarboniphaga sp.]|uniref:serine hydrolase domain-containing protein n=1 Tax=Hydrocarboniphaga sp. TaxID=2033016 RepID=UPI003D13542D